MKKLLSLIGFILLAFVSRAQTNTTRLVVTAASGYCSIDNTISNGSRNNSDYALNGVVFRYNSNNTVTIKVASTLVDIATNVPYTITFPGNAPSVHFTDSTAFKTYIRAGFFVGASDTTGIYNAIALKQFQLIPTAVKTSTYTAVANDIVLANTTNGSFTVPLPVAPADKTVVALKLVATASNNMVTLACGGSDAFNYTGGSTSLTLSAAGQLKIVQYQASTALWVIIGSDNPIVAQVTIPNNDDLDVLASTYQGPFSGGRTKTQLGRSAGVRVLANLATVAGIQSAPATLTDVTSTDALYGTTALQLTSAANTQVNIAQTSANAVPVNVTGGIIRIWFKVISNVTAQLNKFSVELYSAGTPASPSANYHALTPFTAEGDFKARFTNTANGAGRWQSYSIAVPQFTAVSAGADLTAIIYARLVLRSTATMSIQLGNIEFIPNKLNKAKVIFGFDDGYLSHFTYVAGQLAKYGFPGVSFPSPVATTIGSDVTKLTVQQLKTMHDNLGWQIASQAWTTESNTIVDAWTENQFTAELSKLRNWQNSLGLTGGEDGSYFSSVAQADLIAYPTFRKHFRTMRAYFSGNGSGVPFPVGETYPFGDPMAIRALNGATWTDGTNTAQVQAHVDQAIANKGVAMIVYHDDLASAGNVRTGFAALLAYLDTHRDVVDVVTLQDLAAIPTVTDLAPAQFVVVAKNDVTAQTAANTSILTYTPQVTSTFRVGGYLNVTAVATDVIKTQVTYTDENSNATTVDLYSQGATSQLISTTGNSFYPTVDIRAKVGTAITVKTTLTIGGGTITYDAGGTISQFRQ